VPRGLEIPVTRPLSLLLIAILAAIPACPTENRLTADTGHDVVDTGPPRYAVGGEVTGLQGTGLVLQLNGGDDLSIDADGRFAFPDPVPDGTDYAVTVSEAPSDPAQDCTVTGGSGTIAGARVSDVEVTCAVPDHTVSVDVSGLDAPGLLLRLNGGGDLIVDAPGTYTFPTPLVEGESYDVTVRTQPACPGQVCTVSGGTGVIGTSDVTVPVTCGPGRVRLLTSSWGDDAVRITDDLLALGDGDNATPRVIAGENTTISNPGVDAIAGDGVHDLVYLADDGVIKVWEGASTSDGDLPPDRTFGIDGDALTGVESDAADDRLYAVGHQGLYAFDGASALDGTVLPDVTIQLSEDDGAVAYDAIRDRLYVRAAPKAVWVFDRARDLADGTPPDRTITWTNSSGFKWFFGLAVDGCTERLYLASNVATPGGAYLVVIPASTSGAVDLDHVALAEYGQTAAIAIHRDDQDHLYVLEDSATAVHVFDGASTWFGSISAAPDATISGTVAKGYGIDSVAY